MKNVSNDFVRMMAERTDFYLEASVKFTDGTELELEKSDFYATGNGYTDAAGSSSFPIGAAIEKQIEIYLINDEDQYHNYNFIGAEFTIYCCLDLDSGATERILLGTFTVTDPETYGTIITVIAVDGMYRGDVDYSTTMTFPLSIGEAIRDSCSTCGVTLINTTFENDDYIISAAPEGITHRSFWGMCAMLAGGNARMDEYNRLHIFSYNFSLFDRPGLNGGIFDTSTPYSTGDAANGGIFNPWNTGDTVDGGTFIEMKDYHVLWKAKNLTVATDDVVITGVQTTIDEETYLYGNEGYILSITNNLIEGNPQDAVNRIGALIVGVRFRPFELDHPACPVADMGDVCFLIDRKQNIYQSIITDINFTFYGYTTIQCQADNPIRNSSKYNSQLTQAIVQSRLNTQRQITEYDKAVQMLTSLITQSFGVFKTEEVLDDGSIIYYMHNKPTLEESQTIWKMTADAFAVSTNGGQTWNAGMDSSGNAVLNVLSTIGINFSWASGGTLTLGGSSNGNGILRILDSNGTQIGYINNTGVNFNQGRFSGSLMGATGTFSGSLVAATGTFAGDLSAASGTFQGRLISPTGNIGGFVIASSALYTGSHSSINSANPGVYLGSAGISCTQAASKYVNLQSGYLAIVSANGASSDRGIYIRNSSTTYSSMISCNEIYIADYDSLISEPVFQVDSSGLYCSGSKNRVVRTDNYGLTLLYCYEMTSPMFGDIGSGVIGDDGTVLISFDDSFYETVNTKSEYYVFLQKEGKGDLWVQDKQNTYFIVQGTPGLRFAWEAKARQKDFEYDRLENYSRQKDDIDYEEEAADYVQNFYDSLEVLIA